MKFHFKTRRSDIFFNIEDKLCTKLFANLDTLHGIEQNLRKSLERKNIPAAHIRVREIRLFSEEITQLINQYYKDLYNDLFEEEIEESNDKLE